MHELGAEGMVGRIDAFGTLDASAERAVEDVRESQAARAMANAIATASLDGLYDAIGGFIEQLLGGWAAIGAISGFSANVHWRV